MSCVDQVQNYFESYNAEQAKDQLGQICEAPIYKFGGRTVVPFALNAILAVLQPVVIYSQGVLLLKKYVKAAQKLPQLSGRAKRVVYAALPFYAYRVIQMLFGYALYPQTYLWLSSPYVEEANRQRQANCETFKRMRIGIDTGLGYVSGMIQYDFPDSKRWIVFSCDVEANYESYLSILKEEGSIYKANTIFYNYSRTWFGPSPQSILTSHQAVLSFLEDGMGAEEIIDWSYNSLGGIRAQMQPRKSKYVTIDYHVDQSFPGKWLVEFFGWKSNPYESIKNNKHPAIIIGEKNDSYEGSLAQADWSDASHVTCFKGEVKVEQVRDAIAQALEGN